MMSYYMDTTIGNPSHYPLPRPLMMRQGDVGSYEDPWMSCGLQSTCYQQRAIYSLWDEAAIQEVPTGLEYYSTGIFGMVYWSSHCGQNSDHPDVQPGRIQEFV